MRTRVAIKRQYAYLDLVTYYMTPDQLKSYKRLRKLDWLERDERKELWKLYKSMYNLQ